MTVSTTDSVIEYVSGGPAYPIPFRFLQNSDIQAVLVKQDGTSETLVLGTQYTLVGAGTQSGGTLTSGYAAGYLATAGASLTIARIMTPVQPTDLRNQGRFLAETHESVFDRLTMLIQQAIDGLSRALVRPYGKNYYDALNRQIKNLADPTLGQDAANKRYVQQQIADLLQVGSGSANNAANILYVPNGPGQVVRVLQDRVRDIVCVKDYVDTPIDGVTSNQEGLVRAVAAAKALNADLEWPSTLVPLVSTETIPDLHSVRHVGSGVIKAGSNLFYVNPDSRQMNSLYIEPGGTGDGLTAARPLAGINGSVEALRNYAPLVGRWTVFGSGGGYNEAVILPDWLANGGNYLAFTFPAPAGSQAEPATYAAVLNGIGVNSLQGFLSGAGNRISISNLHFANWFDPAFANTSQVRRAFNASNGSFAFLVNCAFTGNGLSNVAALPGATVVLTGGVLDGGRFGIDNTGGRISLSATASTYSVIRNALEYGLYQKHESSTVIDFAEFRNNGKHPAAVRYGAAIFAYKSNASVDTRGVKFYANNICWNVRGGFVADNPGNPDVYGSGADANTRRYLCRAGGRDDIDTWETNVLNDMTKRFSGGSTTSATDALLLNQIAETREGYLSNIDQCLRLKIVGRAQTGDALITPLLRYAGGTISLGTYRIATGKYGEIRLTVRPTTARNALQVLFSCTDAIQNLGSAVGLILTSAIDLPNVALSVEVNGRAEGGGTASLITCVVDKSG
ncbi:hypothetical protein [Pseudomonas monteilii]|uniref:hypothetical protein n=1 Tax=Pseudomonas monteilii TaxID=76759 RepID=UPI001E54B116|nr:hypothetical protein [Pseudomonas monteilii]MCE0931627.1 hypothetical protein [Pseudomonas monteilii]MCE1009183.1 hypothetical protein [Pseudomonas monteilii]WJN90215.1 hypothetical protein LU680_10000 [Pseudomonas monteilii]WJO34827.1 hypothetical protein LU690_08675 [Pseudomonas monteilii]WJR41172.1 hypothetical protein LU662_009250 [Pseudomonas monteilii]